mmetsp:Transcript_4670/g.13742  ORF Transcript_4670/g.13742 Transcript_4670/m.13742 type:complete len:425 (+) Transcript_4670:567-1841(+)
MTIASFSRPWKPSTVPTSSADPSPVADGTARSAASSSRSASTCALYGVMTPISPCRSPAASSARTCWPTTRASAVLLFDSATSGEALGRLVPPPFAPPPPSPSSSSQSQPAVSMSMSGASVSSVGSTCERSHKRCSATEPSATSRPPYSSSDAHAHTAACIRYCVVSITPSPAPCGPRRSRSKSVTPKPLLPASSDLTTGGSCWWSPARTARRPRSNATQQDASSACAASSMTTRSKACSGGRQESARSAAPVFVHSTTWLASSSCLTDRLCRSASSRRSVDTSALRAARARLPSRRSWVRAADSSPLTSRTMAAPSETARRASSDAPSTEGSSLAGWPTRTTRSGLPPASPLSSRSAMLSTATFEAAEASTRSPRATACRISSTTAVVLPVPGGPWMRATGRLRSRANWTARRWPAFRPRLTS